MAKEPLCPLFKSPCKKHGCLWYIQVMGLNPQTGQEVNDWGCAVAWMPLLTIETSQQVRQGAAATETFRNEMVKATDMANLIRLKELEKEEETRRLTLDRRLIDK